jgi:hypothetical protein
MGANRKSEEHAVKSKRFQAGKKAAETHSPASPAAGVTLDRRESHDRRGAPDRRRQDVPVDVERRVIQRRVKVNRRRQIDPTTCERDYTPAEIEFMSAMDEYKRRNGRMFPTCSEVLEVIKSLGYEKRPAAEPAAVLPADALPTVTLPAVALPSAPVECPTVVA